MAEQPTLFDEQEANLRRVRAQIAPAILEFCRGLVREGRREFRMQELHHYVQARHANTAPASADRILRQLRREGRVIYSVTNRAQSLYELVSVAR